MTSMRHVFQNSFKSTRIFCNLLWLHRKSCSYVTYVARKESYFYYKSKICFLKIQLKEILCKLKNEKLPYITNFIAHIILTALSRPNSVKYEYKWFYMLILHFFPAKKASYITSCTALCFPQ